NEGEQFQRRREAAVAGRRYAVLIHWHATGSGDFRVDLVFRKNATVPGFGALAELYFNHLDLWLACLLGETLRVEGALFVAAAEGATSQLPDQVAAVIAVIRADA